MASWPHWRRRAVPLACRTYHLVSCPKRSPLIPLSQRPAHFTQLPEDEDEGILQRQGMVLDQLRVLLVQRCQGRHRKIKAQEHRILVILNRYAKR